MSGSVLVFASTSGIGNAVAEELLRRGRPIVLCGRSAAALARQAADLKIKFPADSPVLVWDVLDHGNHGARMRDLLEMAEIEGVVMAAGAMFPQAECESDPEKTRLTLETNFIGVALVLELFAAHFQARGRGFISCISSVAGDRGRRSNYVYGSSKAGLSAYLQGLRNRMARHGVLVQTVKPGFVKTRMTAGMKASPLMVSPEKAARDIVNGIEKGKDILYTPFFWKYIMAIIKAIPESVFKKMSL